MLAEVNTRRIEFIGNKHYVICEPFGRLETSISVVSEFKNTYPYLIHYVSHASYRAQFEKAFMQLSLLSPEREKDCPHHNQRGGKGQQHNCQMAITKFVYCMCLALRAWRTIALLCYTAKFDRFLSLDCAP